MPSIACSLLILLVISKMALVISSHTIKGSALCSGSTTDYQVALST
jgi:hypothetical protein